jgi:hypothetical protein
MYKKEISAYCAGLFDGEGYVGIDKTSVSHGKVRKIHHSIRVVISQKDGAIMNWLKERFGGNVYEQRNGTKYSIYRWRIHSLKAVQFLKCILPYVVIKKKQVEFAIAYYEESKEHALVSARSSSTGRYVLLTEKEIKWRLKKKDELMKMKKEYIIYTKDIE